MSIYANKRSDFKFGQTKVRGIFAGQSNPHRDGIFVEIIVRKGRTNTGTWVRLTDGNGNFWEYEMSRVIIWQDGDTEETVTQRANELFKAISGPIS